MGNNQNKSDNYYDEVMSRRQAMEEAIKIRSQKEKLAKLERMLNPVESRLGNFRGICAEIESLIASRNYGVAISIASSLPQRLSSLEEALGILSSKTCSIPEQVRCRQKLMLDCRDRIQSGEILSTITAIYDLCRQIDEVEEAERQRKRAEVENRKREAERQKLEAEAEVRRLEAEAEARRKENERIRQQERRRIEEINAEIRRQEAETKKFCQQTAAYRKTIGALKAAEAAHLQQEEARRKAVPAKAKVVGMDELKRREEEKLEDIMSAESKIEEQKDKLIICACVAGVCLIAAIVIVLACWSGWKLMALIPGLGFLGAAFWAAECLFEYDSAKDNLEQIRRR